MKIHLNANQKNTVSFKGDDMNFQNENSLTRGRIYVLRACGIKPDELVALALYHQSSYKEWAGCFSAL